jgi:hypothetical protein
VINDSARERPEVAGEIVAHDIGGWISGPCYAVEPVPTGQVLAGDVLLIDGAEARIVARRIGVFRIGGEITHGLAIDWDEQHGTARGTLFRHPADILYRLRPAD